MEQLNLYQKLSRIRAISDVAQKDSKGYGYRYTSLAEILSKVSAGMKRYGVSLIPKINSELARVEKVVTVNTKTDRAGNMNDVTTTEMLFTSPMIFVWVNDENPDETIEVPWFVTGAQSDPSMSFGSALTYCMRYFLTCYFQIAQTENDVDEYRSKQKEAEAAEDKSNADAIIQEFDKLLKAYIADHEDKKEEVKKFISRYAKDANYKLIKEPTLAAKLLDDFKTKFMNDKKTKENK